MLPEPSDVNPYLQQEVLSASPLRLRWMLIQRSVELCGLVDQLWAAGQHELSHQWLLRIREILGELLHGVQDAANPLSKSLTDFYLYLLQLAFEVEKKSDRELLGVLADLLAIESETWRLVVEKAGTESADQLPAVRLIPDMDHAFDSVPGGFSLEV